jgi:hypothetical protein
MAGLRMPVDSAREAKWMGLSSFLKHVRLKLSAAFKGRFNRNPQSAYENLSRFIFQRNHYSLAGPKPGAFLPPKDKSTISMFWIDRLEEPNIWNLGDFAGKNRGKPAVARADVSSYSVSEIKLTVEADPEPHPRHANVGPWPDGKDAQKALALDLCAKSRLSIRVMPSN